MMKLVRYNIGAGAGGTAENDHGSIIGGSAEPAATTTTEEG
jgi:hypothetical protein